jgi:hypothetical protein
MSNSPSSISAQALAIHSRFGIELAFVVPNEDTGLLPINSFFMELEDLANTDMPELLVKSISKGREWLNETFEGTMTF